MANDKQAGIDCKGEKSSDMGTKTPIPLLRRGLCLVTNG